MRFPLIDGVRSFLDIVQQVILLLLDVKAQGFAILDNLANLLQTGCIVITLVGRKACVDVRNVLGNLDRSDR